MHLIKNSLSRKREETLAILHLAWPIVIAQLAQHSIGFVDTLMAARAGAEDLAAIALGTSIWIPVFLALSGILMATTPLVAHLVGANKTQDTPNTLHQGLWIALVLGLIALLILNNTDPLLALLSLEPSLQDKTRRYLEAISLGFPALLLFQVIRSYCEGFGKTRPVMKIAIIGLLCNIPLNYVLIFGKFGFPELGGVGCGWASAIVMWIILLCGSGYLHKSPSFAPLKLWQRWQKPQFGAVLSFLRLGTPIGFALLIEASMFCVIALLLAKLGDIVLAAHQITISFTGMVFMLPLSIAISLTIRVGQLSGAGQAAAARYAAFTGIQITLLFALISTTLTLLFARGIARLYTPDIEILDLAASLLVIAALFQLSDAIQVSAAGALRGYKDTSIPLILVFISFWVIGLPVGYLLSLTDILVPAMGPAGFWYGLVIGLSAGAVLLMTRLHLVSRHDQSP
ncbi:MATE family efflux transporter [Nitrincola alkalilacustris]|uniref:MATE family efflux transporter n=1 Tax=Nitrincola alkalilacustris TaxID=1571224 RepID=UPI00124DC073|nr:MATE family efflux transporter [Nitrincola alkalilacustris]